MRQLWSIIVCIACAFAAPAFSAQALRYYGPDNCRIAQLEPAPSGGRVRWSGQCKGGFAEGPGVLEWSSADWDESRLEGTLVRGEVSGQGKLHYKQGKYTGTFRRGLPHGQGYFEYADASGWYEGEVRDGKRHGHGIWLGNAGASYEGQWQDDQEHGIGRASFALGGSYDGEWKNGQFDGKGSIVYAGSGHRYEGRFVAGRVAGAAPRKVDTGSYVLRDDQATSSSHFSTLVNAPVPVNAPWARLTEAQRNKIKAYYFALEEGDEPPFPLNGLRELFDAVATIMDHYPSESGVLRLYVLVGADGIAKTATTVGALHPELKRLVSAAAMLQRYKSARCRGKPCAMVYPLSVNFKAASR